MNIFDNPPKDRAIELLKECDLPYCDLSELHFRHFLGCGDVERPSGIVGLQVEGKEALLRSLAVTAEMRGSGCGKALVTEIEKQAKLNGIEKLYLLTNTAELYFNRIGYLNINRSSVPEWLRKTQEFSSLCPDDAAVLCKQINQDK